MATGDTTYLVAGTKVWKVMELPFGKIWKHLTGSEYSSEGSPAINGYVSTQSIPPPAQIYDSVPVSDQVPVGALFYWF